MVKYIIGRLLVIIPMLLGASLIVFIMMRFGGADPALNYLRLSQIPPSEEALANAREALGLNRPLVVQYLDWLWKALHLDFGLSYVSRKPADSPWGLAWDKGNNVVWVASTGTNTITAYSINTGVPEEKGTLKTIANARAVAIDADGNLLVGSDSELQVLDADTLTNALS